MKTTILVIDDDEGILSYIKKLLTLNGYTAYFAENEKEAIIRIAEEVEIIINQLKINNLKK